MSERVNLLLLFSALLSALTGVGGAVRGGPAPVAVTRVAEQATVAGTAKVRAAQRPSLPAPALTMAPKATALPIWRLAPFAPRYFGRRRE